MKRLLLAFFVCLIATGAFAQVNYGGVVPTAGDQACFLNTLGQVTDCANIGTASINTTIRSGAFASRPTASLGGLYQATDLGPNGVLLISNGTYWKPATGSAVIYQSAVQTTLVTGGTTETNVGTVTIPAGLLSANGALRITGQAVKTGTNATAVWNIRWSSISGSTNGNTVISITSTAATKLSESFSRMLWNRNSASAQVSAAVSNYGSGESTNTSSTFSINTASAAYLNLTATPGNAADAVGFDAITVEWTEP